MSVDKDPRAKPGLKDKEEGDSVSRDGEGAVRELLRPTSLNGREVEEEEDGGFLSGFGTWRPLSTNLLDCWDGSLFGVGSRKKRKRNRDAESRQLL